MLDFGNILRAARLRAGLTAREVAQTLGVSESRVSLWENGRAEPRARVLSQYVEAELLSPDEALGAKAIDGVVVAS